jgi:hypothetical protein
MESLRRSKIHQLALILGCSCCSEPGKFDLVAIDVGVVKPRTRSAAVTVPEFRNNSHTSPFLLTPHNTDPPSLDPVLSTYLFPIMAFVLEVQDHP